MTFRPFAAALLALVSASSAAASTVVVDTASARAVLEAVQNPDLTPAEALVIAKLPGNQGLVRKANSQHVAATTADFAAALVDVAHGTPARRTEERVFALDRIKAKAATLIALIGRIEADPRTFKDWVVARVSQFSPDDPRLKIEGYLVAGGVNGGFAFDDPRFYLNLGYFDEFEAARSVMAHELYHAVQAAYTVDNDDIWLKPESPTVEGKARQQLCAGLAGLFTNLYQEGSASFLGDALQLDPAWGPLAKKMRDEMQQGLALLPAQATLLELSVTGLKAPKPVPFDQVYALGFNVPEPLYKLGYAMAKAMAADLGPAALTAQLKRPGYDFVQRYVALPKYGKDPDHPKLGENTIDAADKLATQCRRG